jgi:6-pyruvoyltetrahydropterin/6-carboxytetrahydropterin synthase
MYTCSKEIDIDAAHRVTFHESKCRNLHGHRYTIQLHVQAESLRLDGSEQGMVMDFSYIKALMMEHIDAPCDHGTIVWVDDIELLYSIVKWENESSFGQWIQGVRSHLTQWGSWSGTGKFGKLYIVPCVPTAENLAQHWYDRLAERVSVRSGGHASIQRVRVWETRSSYCDYPSAG